MSEGLRQEVLDKLQDARARIEAAGSDSLAKYISDLIHELEKKLLGILIEAIPESSSSEDKLYARAVVDYERLQDELSKVRSYLSSHSEFLVTLQRRGDDIEGMQRHLAIVAALDMALQHLIHLMQYDTQQRTEVDIRKGFRLISAGALYGHTYFEPSK